MREFLLFAIEKRVEQDFSSFTTDTGELCRNDRNMLENRSSELFELRDGFFFLDDCSTCLSERTSIFLSRYDIEILDMGFLHSDISDISCSDREWVTDLSLYEHLRIGLSYSEIREVIRTDMRIKVARHHSSILSRNTK